MVKTLLTKFPVLPSGLQYKLTPELVVKSIREGAAGILKLLLQPVLDSPAKDSPGRSVKGECPVDLDDVRIWRSLHVTRAPGNTPLALALTLGDPDVVQVLLDAGATLQAVNPLSGLPVIHATAQRCQSGRLIKILFDALGAEEGKAQVQRQTSGGVTPLHAACRSVSTVFRERNIETAKMLISLGANVNATDNNEGQTPLHCAVLARWAQMIEYLVTVPGIELEVGSKKDRGITPVYLAACHPPLLQTLLDAGANANPPRLICDPVDIPQGHYGRTTPLEVAIAANAIQSVTALLNAGADALCKTPQAGETPLMLAVQSGKAGVVDALLTTPSLEHGARTLEIPRNNDGYVPLHVAAADGNHGCIFSLLLSKADPNVGTRSEDALTPLHLAVQTEEPISCTTALLGAGADPRAPNAHGQSALDWAINNEWKEGEQDEGKSGDRLKKSLARAKLVQTLQMFVK